MFLLCDGTIVIGTCENYEITDTGNLINLDNSSTYGFIPKVYEVAQEDLPEDFKPFKYRFTEDEGFIKDENYTEQDPLYLEHQLELAFQRIAELETALCELSEEI